jgi:unsaturated chondroitin disaccharide hydrolase
MTFRETGDPVFLEAARGLADYFIEYLPEDHVPYWDFNAPDIPDEEKDASAAAIAASGMLELSEITGDDQYHDQAVRILKSLSSPEYQAKGVNDAILLHSVGSKPGDSEVDVPIIYAEYYYVEALLRLLDLEDKVN